MMFNGFGRGYFRDYGCPFVDRFGGTGYFVAAGIAAITILALVAIFVILSRRRKSNDDRALYILKERFANGDIDEEEYERKIKLLK